MANSLSPLTLQLLAQRGLLPQQGNVLGLNPLAGAPAAPGAAVPPPATPPSAVPPSATPAPAAHPGMLQSILDRMRNPQLLPGAANPTPAEQQAAMASPTGVEARSKVPGAGLPPAESSTESAAPGYDFAQPRQPARLEVVGGAAGGAPATIPAHEVRTVSPTAEGMLTRAQDEQQAAAKAGEQGELGENKAKVAALDHVARQAAADDQGYNTREQERRAALEAQQQDYDKLQQEAATGKPDYGRFMRSKGAFGQAVAAIASGLGAFGASLTHSGQNSALEIINGAINRDIEQQRDELSQKQATAKLKGSSLAQMRERFGDERMADMAERAKQLEIYQMQGNRMVAEAQSPIISARWQNTSAGIGKQKAELYAQMHQWAQASTAGGARGMSGLSDVKPEEVVDLGGGRMVTVPEKDREHVVTAQRSASSVQTAGKDLLQLLTVPVTQRGLDWAKQYDATQKMIATAEIQGGGKGGKGMTELLLHAQGGRTLTLTPGVQQAVQEVVRGATQRAEAAIQSSAQHEVQPVLYVDPKTGEQKRKYRITGVYERPEKPAYNIRPAGTE